MKNEMSEIAGVFVNEESFRITKSDYRGDPLASGKRWALVKNLGTDERGIYASLESGYELYIPYTAILYAQGK